MKKFLRFLFIAAIIFSFTSCIKTVDSPAPAVNPIAGSWYLYDATESYGSDWYAFNANIYGVLTFYSNGSAQYDDGNLFMHGTWYMNDINDGYYDRYGNYYSDWHQNFEASLNGNGRSLDLYFDNISFVGNNKFIGTYYTGESIQRYTFVRAGY